MKESGQRGSKQKKKIKNSTCSIIMLRKKKEKRIIWLTANDELESNHLTHTYIHKFRHENVHCGLTLHDGNQHLMFFL